MKTWVNTKTNETVTGKLIRIMGNGWMMKSNGCVWLLNDRTWNVVKDGLSFWELVMLAALAYIALC